jgi:uncharacterized linocin/CFP29 family protein
MGADMTANDPQVPWAEEQWARVNQVIQEEVSRARVAATFLPLYGPMPADSDFVRQGNLSYPLLPRADRRQQSLGISINDQVTMQLATLQVKVYVRAAQMADSEMKSVLDLFRRAANVLARLEDAVVFGGLLPNFFRTPPVVVPPFWAVAGLPAIWEILGGQPAPGLVGAGIALPVPVIGLPPPPPPSVGGFIAAAVATAIGLLEGGGHFGPFAVVLGNNYFAHVQSPQAAGNVLPQDQIIPFLGGGPLLRCSVLNPNSGIMVALGGAPIELVVATDVSLQFLQVTNAPLYLFRVREKMALRIKEPGAIVTLW